MTPHLNELIHDYIDPAKRAANLTSDLALDRELGVRTQVCKWRKGKTYPSETAMFKIAELAGKDPSEAVAKLKLWEAERADNEEQAAIWSGILGRLSKSAFSLVAAVILCNAIWGQNPAKASEMNGEVLQNLCGKVYIMAKLKVIRPSV